MNVIIPKAGLTMTEAVIGSWLVQEGDRVTKGQVILEITTEKITVEVAAPETGTIQHILKHVGDEVPVGETIAILKCESGEEPDVSDRFRTESASEGAPLMRKTPEQEVDSDVIVIGGGPGGYVAAIRAAQLGGKVILVERDHLGGTCLNRGCIPTKILLHAAKMIETGRKAEKFGIRFGAPEISYEQLNLYKNKAVDQLRNGITSLLKKNGVRLITGTGLLKSPTVIEVLHSNGQKETFRSKNIILATGAKPMLPDIPGLSEARPLFSEDLLNVAPIKKMAIIGSGAIGVEFACVYALLGTEVVLLEREPSILPKMDKDLSSALSRALNQLGVQIRTGVSIEQVKQEKKGNPSLTFTVKDRQESLEVDEILIASGWNADVREYREMNLVTEGGKVWVDSRMRTSVPGIYAVGDLTGLDNLAHVASAQGIVAAENCMGGNKEADYSAMPKCIYTLPEISSVGLTEDEAIKSNIDVDIGKYYFKSHGRALTEDETEGFVKVIIGKKYREILGVHIIGSHATELISEAVTAMKLEATADEWIEATRPHPSMSEAIPEAVLAALGRAVHS